MKKRTNWTKSTLLFPIIAQRYFDAQWEAYRNDRSRFCEFRKPEHRNLDEIWEAFAKKIKD